MRINSKGKPRAWRQPSGGPFRLVRVMSTHACCPLWCHLSFSWCGPKSCPLGLPEGLFPQLFKISVLEQGRSKVRGPSEPSLASPSHESKWLWPGHCHGAQVEQDNVGVRLRL